MESAIEQVRRAVDQKTALRVAYDILTKRYRGGHLETITRFWELFDDDVPRLWTRSGFLHCTNANHLLRALLLQSGQFTPKDIASKWTLHWYISPHQYLTVQTPDGPIDVDVWAHTFGIPFGRHA